MMSSDRLRRAHRYVYKNDWRTEEKDAFSDQRNNKEHKRTSNTPATAAYLASSAFEVS